METYGLEVYSYLSATLSATLFNTYAWTGEVEFVPAEIVPYQQTISWKRLENDDDGTMFSHAGMRSIELLQLTTTFTENAKTFERSFVDWFDDMDNYNILPHKSDWIIDEDNESEYDDAYWNLDVFHKLVDETPSWYGAHNYYTASYE